MRVTTSASFARSHIIPFIPAFFNQYPDVTLDLNLTDTIVDIVEQGYDVAFRIVELVPSSLLAQRIDDNPQALVATPEYIAKNGMPETPQDLLHHTCLPLGETRLWRLVDENGVEHETRVDGPLKVNLGDAVGALVLSGMGIGFTALWHSGPDLASGRLVRVLPNYRLAPETKIWAVRPPGRSMPARVKAFLDFMQARIVETNKSRYGDLDI
ncbi:substrate binding domain-containing protein [Hyphococcus sp. DH-69]|uniref:substrate binding domain-containing protein n=1 Tax=Hyphococcus formosus TaxID=3143534 RepID=UPI00398A54F0